MKNGSLILNVVLLIAVAVLFFLHFSSPQKTDLPKVQSSTASGTAPQGDCKIAYFVMDSINNAFKMVKDVRAELSKEEEKMNSDLAGLQKRYNDKFTQFQSQAAKGTLSAEESDKVNREIVQMQQSFAAAKQELGQRLQDLSMRKMQDVKTRVEDFLKEYNKSKGYTYILGYEPGFMFYRDTAYDITTDLIKGLNAGYKKK